MSFNFYRLYDEPKKLIETYFKKGIIHPFIYLGLKTYKRNLIPLCFLIMRH